LVLLQISYNARSHERKIHQKGLATGCSVTFLV